MVLQEKLFNHLFKSGITPNSWCVLYSIYKNVSYRAYFPDMAEYSKLVDAQFIRQVEIRDEDNFVQARKFELTSKGLAFVEEMEGILSAKLKKQALNTSQKEEWALKISEFQKKFPKGGGYRGNARDVMQRFVWFFSEYPEFNWDVVMKATDLYINETNPAYLKYCQYFISKSDAHKIVTSVLANYCQRILDGDESPETQQFAVTVF